MTPLAQPRQRRPRRVPGVLSTLGVLAALAGCAADGVTDEGPPSVSVRAVGIAPFEDVPETVPAGTLTLELVNEGDLGHSLRIEELDDGVAVVPGGGRGDATLTFEAGRTYTFLCDVPGHREAGMEGRFSTEP